MSLRIFWTTNTLPKTNRAEEELEEAFEEDELVPQPDQEEEEDEVFLELHQKSGDTCVGVCCSRSLKNLRSPRSISSQRMSRSEEVLSTERTRRASDLREPIARIHPRSTTAQVTSRVSRAPPRDIWAFLGCQLWS